MELIEKNLKEKKEEKTSSSPFGQNVQWRGKTGFSERKCNFSLDFSAFGQSVHVGPRGKADLPSKGYAWTPVLRSFDNSKR